MVPLPPEVKRNARLEHDRRQAERRFADPTNINLSHLQAKRLTLLQSRRAAAHPANKINIARPETPKRNRLLA
jgi:hypothetical protein